MTGKSIWYTSVTCAVAPSSRYVLLNPAGFHCLLAPFSKRSSRQTHRNGFVVCCPPCGRREHSAVSATVHRRGGNCFSEFHFLRRLFQRYPSYFSPSPSSPCHVRRLFLGQRASERTNGFSSRIPSIPDRHSLARLGRRSLSPHFFGSLPCLPAQPTGGESSSRTGEAGPPSQWPTVRPAQQRRRSERRRRWERKGRSAAVPLTFETMRFPTTAKLSFFFFFVLILAEFVSKFCQSMGFGKGV